MAIGAVCEPNGDVRLLSAAVDVCRETPLSCLSAEELSDRLVLFAEVTAKLDAARVEAVAAARRADVRRLNDQRNTANHLADRVPVDPADVRADERIGRWLADFDLFAEAYGSGVLTTAHIDKLRKADNVRVHRQMIADQVKFVGWLTTCAFRDLDRLIGEWLLGADPDGAAPDEQEPATGLSINVLPDGCSNVKGRLNPLQTQALLGRVEPEGEKIRQHDAEAGIERSVRKRNLEALLSLTERGAARPDGGFSTPRVNIVCSQRVYEDTLRWLADPARNPFPEIDSSHIDKKCQLIDGTPIHPLYAVAAAAIGTFRHIVYNAKGRAIHATYDSRKVPDWMRDITLAATNGGCANPVCDAPHHWLTGDHIEPWSHTGVTRLEDTRNLCGADNGWRGNDTTRGIWAAPDVDWSGDGPIPHPDWDEVAEQLDLVDRSRLDHPDMQGVDDESRESDDEAELGDAATEAAEAIQLARARIQHLINRRAG